MQAITIGFLNKPAVLFRGSKALWHLAYEEKCTTCVRSPPTLRQSPRDSELTTLVGGNWCAEAAFVNQLPLPIDSPECMSRTRFHSVHLVLVFSFLYARHLRVGPRDRRADGALPKHPGGEEAAGADVRALLAGGLPPAAAERTPAGGQRVGRPVCQGEQDLSMRLSYRLPSFFVPSVVPFVLSLFPALGCVTQGFVFFRSSSKSMRI